MSILDLFCSVDEFWQRFEPQWQRELVAAGRRRRRRGRMCPSELMTILILFQQSQYRTFKAFYTQQVQRHWRAEFPGLVSYGRFVELMPSVLVPLTVYLQTRLGACTGISFIDSTALAVCHNARIRQHRVFALDAARGKTSVDWCYGCKLHLVVNDRGELLAFCHVCLRSCMLAVSSCCHGAIDRFCLGRERPWVSVGRRAAPHRESEQLPGQQARITQGGITWRLEERTTPEGRAG